MTEAPTYPNLDETLGTTVPLITALLASGSIALAVVPITVDVTSSVEWFGLSVGVGSLVLSSTATGLLVFATLMAVYAHASSIDSVPADRQLSLKGDIEADAWSTLVDTWQDRSVSFYNGARVFWLAGLTCFLLSLGLLVASKALAVLPISVGFAAASSLAMIAAPWENNLARGLQWLAAAALTAVAVVTGLSVRLVLDR